MISNLMIVALQVAILFVLVAVGFAANKMKAFNGVTVKQLTDFVLCVVVPCVIVNSFSRKFEPDKLKTLLVAFGAALLSFAVDILLANILIHDKDKAREKVLRYGAVFSNAGFMAIPLQQALLGDDGVFYGAIFLAVFNMVNWTYGIIIMSGSLKQASVKKVILNPGVIGTLIGILLFITSVKLPQIIAKPVEYFSALNTPLPMVIIGYHLAESSLKIKGANAYFSMAFRLILSPLILLGILLAVKADRNVIVPLIIGASAPFAVTNTMFSDKYGADTKLSASLVSLTTLLSVITMPVVIAIAMRF